MKFAKPGLEILWWAERSDNSCHLTQFSLGRDGSRLGGPFWLEVRCVSEAVLRLCGGWLGASVIQREAQVARLDCPVNGERTIRNAVV